MQEDKRMRAVVYKEVGTFALESRPVPQIVDVQDAIVKITLASICSSDLHIKHGSVPKAKPGVIVGHEMVGEVVEIGAGVKNFKPGDRVIVNVETFCGQCFYCQRGFVNNCTDENGGWALGCRIDGGQAEYVRVPFADQGLNHIPDNVSDEQALFTGDILATGYWGAEIANIQAGDTVVILGAGPTGLCVAMCAALYHPAHLVVIDIDDSRLQLVRENHLANLALNSERDDIFTIISELTDGRGADVVLEVAGGNDTFQLAWQLARPNATVCIVALYEEPQQLPLPDMYGKNLTFQTGGVDASQCDKILQLIAAGKIDTTCLLTHFYPLERIIEAYTLFEHRQEGVMKIGIRP